MSEIELLPWQKRLGDHPRQAIATCRGAGKTTAAAVFCAGGDLGSVGVISPNPSELVRLIPRFAKNAKTSAGGYVIEVDDTVVRLFGDWQTSQMRGFSFDVVLFDNADAVADLAFAGVAPGVAISGGRIIALGTPYFRKAPWSKAKWFERIWKSGDFETISVPSEGQWPVFSDLPLDPPEEP